MVANRRTHSNYSDHPMHDQVENSPRSRLISAGVVNMLVATFAFSVMNVFVKQLNRIPAMEIVFFRCLVSATICFVGIGRAGIDWKGNNNALLIARGASGTLALFMFFVTLQHIPLATAVTIAYLSPIFTMLLGVFLLGEHVRPVQWFFYALAFAGVLVIKGFDTSVPMLYLITGLISAICSGVAYNLVRRLKEREHPLVVVLHFQLVGVVAGFVLTLFNWVAPENGWEWFCLLMCGLLTQFGQTCLTKSLQAERVAHVSILNYTGLIYALLFGMFIFGEIYTWQTILGIVLAVVGVLLSVIYGKPRPLQVIEESELLE
jgi:drug/metabolite transporter (DMT)-like permease